MTGKANMKVLAAFTVFRCKAEWIRRNWLAREMNDLYQKGYAPVAACCFKSTIAATVQILIEQYGYKRSDISIIWGGLSTTKKVKKKRSQTGSLANKKDAFLDRAAEQGVDDELAAEMWAEIEAMEEEVEEKVNLDIPSSYRLMAQNRKARQEEIDRFQSGQSKICFFTFKAGGVGLSLHHTDEMTQQKVRHKPNGYAIEEDIPLIPIRPRSVILTPTYSAPELVQGLGRCPRLTSLSDTNQFVVFYRGTIEERVAQSVSQKLKCLKKVTRLKESWEDIITKHNHKGEVITEDIKELPSEQIIQSDNPEEDSFLGSDSDGDDEGGKD